MSPPNSPPSTIAPRTITVEITYRCHRRCAFCYVPGLSSEAAVDSSELSADALCRAMAALVGATGCKQVQLSGGEPLLRSDLCEVIEGIQSTGASVSISAICACTTDETFAIARAA